MKNNILDNKIIMALFIISCLAIGWSLQSILSEKFSRSSGQTITIILLEKEDILEYKTNLDLIADEKCNKNWQQLSYSSNDYSANIICRDKTEFNLDLKTVMSYSGNKKE